MTYIQKRHIQLLKRWQDLKNQGKSLYHENIDEYLELTKYEETLESYIYWKSRTLFLLFMEKFVDRIISDDSICGTIDVVGGVSSAVGLVIGNIPANTGDRFRYNRMSVCKVVLQELWHFLGLRCSCMSWRKRSN